MGSHYNHINEKCLTLAIFVGNQVLPIALLRTKAEIGLEGQGFIRFRGNITKCSDLSKLSSKKSKQMFDAVCCLAVVKSVSCQNWSRCVMADTEKKELNVHSK